LRPRKTGGSTVHPRRHRRNSGQHLRARACCQGGLERLFFRAGAVRAGR